VIALAVAAVVVVAAVLATALVPPGADGTDADADADAADGSGVDDRAANASPGTVGGESPTPTPTPAADVEARTPTATPVPTRTPAPAAAPDADDDAGAGSDSGADSESAPDAETRPRFTLEVVDATECGTTCRDVTAELSNVGDTDATDIVVETTILVAGDEIWTGETDVGTVEAGETETRTERVEISLLEAAAVQSNDGYVTVETEVRWDGGRQTFSERVQTR
jgi:hypothetical protein